MGHYDTPPKSGNVSEEGTGKNVRGRDRETSVHSTAVALMNSPPKSDIAWIHQCFMGEEGQRGPHAFQRNCCS